MISYYPEIKRYSSSAARNFTKSLFFPALLLTVSLWLSSCTERSTSIGSGLLPGSDFNTISSTDTIVPRTYNTYLDSVISNKITYSYFGGLYDPYFGNTYCDFVGQLRLSAPWPGGNPTVDSVKLYLSVSGVKGDLTFHPAIQLYEITEQLVNTTADTVYYSNRDVHAGQFIGIFPLGELTKDTITNMTAILPNTFGEYLLRDTTKLNQEGGTDDFRSFFKGLWVSLVGSDVPVKKKGSFLYVPEVLVFNPSVDNFVIRVYYHTQTSTNILAFDFVISDKGTRYNRYFHDLSTADPLRKIRHVNDGIMDTTSCVQSFYGVAGTIKFPGLEYYKSIKPGLAIDKARLTYHVLLDGDLYTTTTVPNLIYLAFVDSTGKRNLVQDFTVNSGFYGGTFNSTDVTYTFNLAAFIQAYLRGGVPKPELEMYLPEGETKSALLKGVGSVSPPKLVLVYTHL